MNNIISDKNIFDGKPVIKGTRIPVDLISDYIIEGRTVDDIKKDFPHLTTKQIASALDYISKKIDSERKKFDLCQTC